MAMVILIHIFNISIDTIDEVQQQGFWVTEIESFFELVSEQVLGIENAVRDQDESEMETTAASSASCVIVIDFVSIRTVSFDFAPCLLSTLEASLLKQIFYSDILRAKLTPPPRHA